ncbi:hypothetical protein [Roseateles sp. L2-2]|uniref:hypothetical protein n=1 Tax=Roseateles sp. L2-2 TaxID=3422597 RepID=UPI000B4D2CE0|nr:hypothetical protein CDL60_25630 [Roseateles noduli]
MQLTDEETFALGRLFAGTDALDAAIASTAHRATVIERSSTTCGAFATIRFPDPLPSAIGALQRDWNFSHRDLEHGGSLMASLVYPDVIELEFVAHIEPWPKAFDPSAFSEDGSVDPIES